LECVFWNPKTGERIGPWQVADEMVYRDPANDVFLPSSSGPLAVAWSHDGEKVAIHDKYNRISLLFLNGTTQVLTEDMIPTYPKSALRWSPDDQHILIARDGHAWIVDVSAP
jgi:Tol biopolymer transport system component